MIFPVRCFTCGEVIGPHWKKFEAARLEDKHLALLDDLGYTADNFCCRMMFLGHVDALPDLILHDAAS